MDAMYDRAIDVENAALALIEALKTR